MWVVPVDAIFTLAKARLEFKIASTVAHQTAMNLIVGSANSFSAHPG